jgi:hypothetical protein
MTNGQKVVQTALGELGITESPWGSNTGPEVDVFTGHYGMHAVPWCGCFAGWCFFKANVDDDGLCSPSTAVTCQRADADGGLRPAPGKPIPPGSLWINCGVHVELVRQDNGDGTVSNIGGNVNQQVALTRRFISDGRIIVPPAVLAGQPEPVTVYGFDDTALRPRRYGGWATREAREAVIANLAADKRAHVRRLRLPNTPSPFAFEIATSTRWRFGPWSDVAAREKAETDYLAGHPGARLRDWSLEQASAPGAMTTGESTT